VPCCAARNDLESAKEKVPHNIGFDEGNEGGLLKGAAPPSGTFYLSSTSQPSEENLQK
jgi:hypothetical protein